MNPGPTTRMKVRADRAPSPSQPPTMHVGGFELTALIHAGPISRVYRARPAGRNSTSDDGDYVVKLIHGDTEHDELLRRMLLREAWLGRHVNHPHIVSVLACEPDREKPYLVMPYLAGATLRNVLDAGHRVPLAHGLWMARQLTDGLDALHRHGWRHADIKPENIHLQADGHATLLDLGMAQPLDEAAAVSHRPLAGTLRYTAPECLVSNSRAEARSDFYSLGVVLYELLAGRVPFDRDDPARLAAAHLEQLPLPPRKLRPDLPSSVCQLILRLLAKDPLRRPATAGELIESLRRVELAALQEEFAA